MKGVIVFEGSPLKKVVEWDGPLKVVIGSPAQEGMEPERENSVMNAILAKYRSVAKKVVHLQVAVPAVYDYSQGLPGDEREKVGLVVNLLSGVHESMPQS